MKMANRIMEVLGVRGEGLGNDDRAAALGAVRFIGKLDPTAKVISFVALGARSASKGGGSPSALADNPCKAGPAHPHSLAGAAGSGRHCRPFSPSRCPWNSSAIMFLEIRIMPRMSAIAEPTLPNGA